MKIGILGAGTIGSTLTQRLSSAGHQVKVANSRGPQTIPAEILTTGAQAVHAGEAVVDLDVLITSIPLVRMPSLAPLLADLPAGAVVIDTSNYYPLRDGHIQALDDLQVESLWVTEQIGRPVVKAWNAITSGSFATRSKPAGDPDRIAIPVAADSDSDRELARTLVDATGFDGFDAGTLTDSWRQQPGAPCYCTDLTSKQMPGALAAADRTRSPRRRDLAMTVIAELGVDARRADDDSLVRVNRLLY
jgi:predicted dinucleotide-binding enzyme